MSQEMHLLGGELDSRPGACLELRVHILQVVVVGEEDEEDDTHQGV